jgi:hypothetical protein
MILVILVLDGLLVVEFLSEWLHVPAQQANDSTDVPLRPIASSAPLSPEGEYWQGVGIHSRRTLAVEPSSAQNLRAAFPELPYDAATCWGSYWIIDLPTMSR